VFYWTVPLSQLQKVAEQLLDFVTTNPLAKTWFTAP